MCKKKINVKSSDFWVDAVCVFVLALVLIITAYPIYFVVISSFSDPTLVNQGMVTFLPKSISLHGYKLVFEDEQIWRSYINTIVYVVIHTIISITFKMMAGYAMSRNDLVGKKIYSIFFLISMYFGGGLIPSYFVMKTLHLTNNVFVLLIMGSVSAYTIFVIRTFIQSGIPEELYEAAVIDGCSHTQYFLKCVVPLSKSIIAVQTLFAAVGQWNSWFNFMLYIEDDKMMPLAIRLRQLLVSQAALMNTVVGSSLEAEAAQQVLAADSMKYAIIVVSTLPILCLYPFLQKYFVKGIMVGSVKG